jgi:flavin reductase (DIM6/NTAB) family NADH-FMN oxidoreductase RutF
MVSMNQDLTKFLWSCKTTSARSPVQFECKVTQIIALVTKVEQGIYFMRSRKIHINEAVLDENAIDQYKIDLVSRLEAIGIQDRIKVCLKSLSHYSA